MAIDLHYPRLEGLFHPKTLHMMANVSDTSSWKQAMNRPNAEGYRDAMDTVMDTLQMVRSRTVMPCNPGVNVLQGDNNVSSEAPTSDPAPAPEESSHLSQQVLLQRE